MAVGKPKIYFLGSGHLAVPILERLVKSDVAVLSGFGTQQDRAAGRGKKLSPTPAGLFMENLGFKPDKPESVNSADFLEKLRGISPDILFVASFGQILKDEILSLPSFACLNAHASILPAYRGASPIQAAILNGENKSGVTFMRMNRGLDTGPAIKVYELEIRDEWKSPDLERELGILAGRHVEEVISGVWNGKFLPISQPDSGVSYAKKIKKEDGRLDWSLEAPALHSRVRAYYPWPCASFEIGAGGKKIHIKITDSTVMEGVDATPGTVIAENARFAVACGKGALVLEKIIPQGRKEMMGSDFIRGFHDVKIKTI